MYNGEGRPAPLHARQSLLTILRGLAQKIKVNDETFVLEHSLREGPYPVTFRLRELGH